jgi:site-specific recombinase XerD
MDEAPEVLKRFVGYMQTVKGKSEKTVEEYYLDLRTFFRYLKLKRGLVPADTPFTKIKIQDIDVDFLKTIDLTQVYEFMNYLMNERHNGAAARARKSCSLRVFFQYATLKVHLLQDNPVKELESPKVKKSLPKYLTFNQSVDLLKQVKGPYRQRDYCMLILFLNCGLRLSELVGLNVSDIRPGTKTLRVVGKGNKERIVYLNEACQFAISEYLAVRPKDNLQDRNALFISKRRKRISPKTVQYLVKKYLTGIDLGGPGYSVHKLRHTAATLMYQYGHVDIRVLKDLLGHENLGTTEIYTHLSDEQLEKAAQANPLSHIKQDTLDQAKDPAAARKK